jgi:hypothetical protein
MNQANQGKEVHMGDYCQYSTENLKDAGANSRESRG